MVLFPGILGVMVGLGFYVMIDISLNGKPKTERKRKFLLVLSIICIIGCIGTGIWMHKRNLMFHFI